MRARVPLEIERIVEPFAAERAQVAFQLAVILQVSVEQTLQFERLVTQSAEEVRTVICRVR